MKNANASSFGQSADQTLRARDLNNYPMMYSVMVMIFIIGIVVDALVFGTGERWIRRRYGLMDASES